jgi:preprotein translocase subunit SecA
MAYSGPSDPSGDGMAKAKAAPVTGKAAAAAAATADKSIYEGVGRNQPCPCGSGKKFKNCHGRAAA